MAKGLYGYAGKILKIDLTTKKVTEIPSEHYLPKYVGGKALAAKIYWDEVPPECRPFDPENRLIFATGPLEGTGAYGSGKMIAASKAPNMYPKQSFTCPDAGMGVSGELKYAGYDAIIIHGKSERPVYLW